MRVTERWPALVMSIPMIALGAMLALGCNDHPSAPADVPDPPTRPTPVAIAMVSGDGQEGKAGEELSEPFAVRVTDAQGGGVGGVEVAWRVVSGAGTLFPLLDENPLAVVTSTDAGGIARASFLPWVIGQSTVVAEAAGIEGSPVAFTSTATVMVIHVAYLANCEGETVFSGPDGSSDVTVPVGTTVEWTWWDWVYEWCSRFRVHIASTAQPPGGEPFDSGIVPLVKRFEFVPAVAGTWLYVDQRNGGGSGTLTAQEGPGAAAGLYGRASPGK